MSDPWITDGEELLAIRNGDLEVPQRSLDLAFRFGLIISSATACRSLDSSLRPIPCPCISETEPCKGPIILGYENDEIIWQCNGCASKGRIRNWQGTPWDLGSLVKARLKQKLETELISEKEFAVLCEIPMLEVGAELALRSAVYEGSRIRITAVAGDLFELMQSA